MKKLRTPFSLVVLISLIPLFGIFSTTKLLHTHDGLAHIPRIAAYFKAIVDGEFPVRWVGDLNYGYGMPLFNYIYQLPYFISSIFLFIGFGLVNSFKLSLSLSYIISAVSIFLFSKEFFKDKKIAFLVSIFYQFSPFRFVELLIRGSFGEVYTYAFFPLLLYSLVRFFKKKSIFNFLLTSISTALLVLSHNGLSLVFFFISVAFVLTFGNEKKTIFFSGLSFFFGLLLSAFYWVPAIFEHKYTYGDFFMRSVYLSHFPPIQNFFIPNFTNWAKLQTQGISVQFGLFHVLAIILSLFALLTKKIDRIYKKFIIFNFVILILTIFIMQPISKPIWQSISLIRQFQFPWRFIAVASFLTSCMSVSYLWFRFFQNKLGYFLLIFLVVISTAFYWKPALGYDKINENYYWNFPYNTTYYGETDVIWSAGPANSYPKKPVEFTEGSGKISDFKKKTTIHTYSVIANQNSTIVDHTQYFPGWKVFVDNISSPIQFQNPDYRGQITFPVSKGIHLVKVEFGEDKLRFISDFVSLSALIFVFILFFFGRNVYYENKRT